MSKYCLDEIHRVRESQAGRVEWAGSARGREPEGSSTGLEPRRAQRGTGDTEGRGEGSLQHTSRGGAGLEADGFVRLLYSELMECDDGLDVGRKVKGKASRMTPRVLRGG